MTEQIVELVAEPMVHKIGKLVVGSIASFVASALAEKAYDAAVTVVRNRRAVS